MLLANSELEDTAFAWSYVLVLPIFYVCLPIWGVNLILAVWSLLKRRIGVTALVFVLLFPPMLGLGLSMARDRPGWLFASLVATLPLVTGATLWFLATARRRAVAKNGRVG